MRWWLLILLLLLAPAPADAAWRRADSAHFIIYSEEKAESLREFATRLEKFDAAMRLIRGLEDPPLGPSNRLTIYAVPSLSSVQRAFGRGGSNVAGFYIPRAAGSIAVVPRRTGDGGTFDMNALTVLLHEYTHHFMMSEGSAAAYPAWYIEGLAEFSATARFEEDGSVGIGLPATHRAYGLILLSIPVEKLFTSEADLRSGESTEAFYSRAWLLTHYLTFEASRKGQLGAYLKALNSGKDSLTAAREVFGDLKTLNADLDKYKLRRRLPYLPIKPDRIRIGPVTVRELSPAEDALMELRIQSDRGVNPEQAKTLVAKIRKAAAPFPNDAAAQAILAEAEYDADNFAAAEAAASRAIAADPKHVDALLYKGRALAGQAVAAKTTDPKVWRAIRGWFVKANGVDAEHAEPLYLYYTSFGEQGVRPPENAVAGLLKAHDLAPQDRGLRMMVAREHLAAGKSEDARFALAPIAYDPHAGEMGKLAARLLATIKDKGAAAALADWDKAGAEAAE